jgi:phosphohistidine phosphatase
MLVGHLPFMERLTSYLITGSIDIPVFKFQNGGIVCMDKDPDSRSWLIRWALMPKIGNSALFRRYKRQGHLFQNRYPS